MLTLVARELRLNLESAYRVYVVAEEVDAERIFRRVGENVEYASPACKLPRLIDIVNLVEAILPQGSNHFCRVYCLAVIKRKCPVVELLS